MVRSPCASSTTATSRTSIRMACWIETVCSGSYDAFRTMTLIRCLLPAVAGNYGGLDAGSQASVAVRGTVNGFRQTVTCRNGCGIGEDVPMELNNLLSGPPETLLPVDPA